jgi:hypothetical protein
MTVKELANKRYGGEFVFMFGYLEKTFRGKLFKKAFERARRGKDISSFERQEKESGFNFLHNPNNGRMQSGHIITDGIGLFKQIIHER